MSLTLSTSESHVTAAGRLLSWLPVREGHYVDRPASAELDFNLKLDAESSELAFAPNPWLQIISGDQCARTSAKGGPVIQDEQSTMIHKHSIFTAIPFTQARRNDLGYHPPLFQPLVKLGRIEIGRDRDKSSTPEPFYQMESSPMTEKDGVYGSQPKNGTPLYKPSGALCLLTAHTLSQSSCAALTDHVTGCCA